MIGDDLLQAAVKSLAVFVQDHRVGVPVELLERQARIVFPLNFLKFQSQSESDLSQDLTYLNCFLEKVPDVLDILLIHGHWKGSDPHFSFFFSRHTSW